MLRSSIALALLLGWVGVALGTTPALTRPSGGQAEQGRWSLLASRLHHLRSGGLKLSQVRALREKRAPDSLSLIVVGCDFSDSLMYGRNLEEFPGWPPQRRTSQFIPGTDVPVFAAHDASYFDLQMQRAADYFTTVSFGQLSLEWSVHPTIVNLPRPMGYYGDADSSDVRVVRMAREVIDAVDDEVDFSLYDTLVLIHAGAGKETDLLGDSPEQIFSNYLDRRDFEEAANAGLIESGELSTGEGPVEHVLVLPEAESQDPIGGLGGFFDVRGVYCFELGLRLGMLSLADFTPAGFPDSQGIGNFGLMGYGLFTGLSIVPAAPSAINRMLMGWVEPVEVREDADLRIGAMAAVGRAVSDTLLVKVPITDREYFLLEYRLQDVDGDLFYTFSDSNANRVPDYYDADSLIGGGIPTSTYDPVTDAWEREVGAEFDYFMSENPVRSSDRCMRGGGSGVYIYHVDERVILNSLVSGTNTINADRDHKGVDVEEADGIQDLDSPRPSPYLLGWDRDVWRGEGVDEFGPDTNPATDSADGLRTGIRFLRFSDVVVDTLARDEEGDCTGFEYRPSMTFRVEFGPVDAGAAPEISRFVFSSAPPLFDPRVVDLGSGPEEPTPDGFSEILLAGDGGRVYAFTGTLDDWVDGDADPLSIGVLARATGPEGPARWLGPPALLRLDEDAHLDVVLVAEDGVHAFSTADGTELADGDGDPATTGVLWAPAEGRLVGPPIAWSETPEPRVLVVYESADGVTLQRLFRRDGAWSAEPGPFARGEVVGPPTRTPDARIAVPWRDELGPGMLVFDPVSTTSLSATRLPASLAEAPTSVVVDGFGAAVAWMDVGGADHLTLVPTGTATDLSDLATARGRSGRRFAAAGSPLVGGPTRANGEGEPWLARASGGELLAFDVGLRLREGFPYRPFRAGAGVSTDSSLVAPIVVDVDGDGRAELLWHEPAGAIHAVDASGGVLPGWPRPGPGEPGGSPAVADLVGDDRLELLTLGRFTSLVEGNAPDRDPLTRAVGELRVYQLGARSTAHLPWPQGRGGPDNSGLQSPSGPDGRSASGLRELLVSPNPVLGDRIRVRAEVGTAADFTVTLFTLEGEEILRAGPFAVPANAALDEVIEVSALVSGLYLCRVAGGGEALTGAFAVVR